NASDQYLEVVKATNIKKLLDQIPHCNTLVTTGKKATEILQTQFNVKEPKIGFFKPLKYNNRELRLYRMPSSSRAYPQTIEKKAEKYKVMFQDIGLL
ncbi:MAG: uracil-DNA glycosylase family protein, partial [Bacteroides sp.]|nr:uracil-DNA glycosylase family protein [Bacteroides sp.]